MLNIKDAQALLAWHRITDWQKNSTHQWICVSRCHQQSKQTDVSRQGKHQLNCCKNANALMAKAPNDPIIPVTVTRKAQLSP